MSFTTLFKPDYDRYEGVRPIIILGMRLGYLMVFLFLGTLSWRLILAHDGPWNSVVAAAVCMWAAHAILSLIGIFHPLKMLPLVFFEVFYKLLWLVVVALPLWWSGRLVGSANEEMTYAFLWVALPLTFVPWGYVFRKYFRWRKPSMNASP
jgi:hypothetical protein